MATKLVLNIVLMKLFGMIGAPISSVIGYFVMAALNLVFVKKYVYKDLKIIKPVGKSLAASVIMAAFALGVYKALEFMTKSVKISVIVAVLLAIVFYFVVNLIIKGIEKDDIMLLPHGEKIYGLLHKIKLMK